MPRPPAEKIAGEKQHADRNQVRNPQCERRFGDENEGENHGECREKDETENARRAQQIVACEMRSRGWLGQRAQALVEGLELVRI
jgi:hypothetical protein